MARQLGFHELKEAWKDLMSEKTFKYRSQHLPRICQADPRDLKKLFLQSRTCITLEKSIPNTTDTGSDLMFAERWNRGKLFDVVWLTVWKKRNRFENNISLFEWIDIGRIPTGYFAKTNAIASFGNGASRGGNWGLRLGEFPDGSTFIPAVEATIRRLKEYNAFGMLIPCVWSIRDPRLATQLTLLKSESRQRRIEAVASIGEMEWNVEQIPTAPKKLATDGIPAFLDALSLEQSLQTAPTIIRGKSLLEKIAIQAPSLIEAFALQLTNQRSTIQIAAVRGLLAVARADRSSIPILMDLISSPNSQLRMEVLKGIAEIFHYGPCKWNAEGFDQSVKDQQREMATKVGLRILKVLKSETDPELITAERLALHRLQTPQRWSPKLNAQIARQCGNLLKLLWPAS